MTILKEEWSKLITKPYRAKKILMYKSKSTELICTPNIYVRARARVCVCVIRLLFAYFLLFSQDKDKFTSPDSLHRFQ